MRFEVPNHQPPLLGQRGPIAFGYGRQSHQDAIDSGEALPAQEARTRAYWEGLLRPKGVEHFIFAADESATSARSVPFMERAAGKSLMNLIQPGDHFIIDKVDRLWRSVPDFVDVRRMFEQRQVKLHIANLMGVSVELGSPGGDFLLNVLVAGAQLESDQAGDRTRARFAGRRAEGRYPGSRPPLGVKLVGEVEKVKARVVRDTRRFVWCAEKRRFMGEIVRLADEQGRNCTDVRGLLRTHFRQFMGESFFKNVIGKNDWTAFAVAKHYWRERQYRALGNFDPNSIKFCVFDPPEGCGKLFRDIGRSEPSTPNKLPFLDGKPIPRLDELMTR